MPANPAKVPSYCRHKASGKAVVRLDGRDHYLGTYGSPESHEAYARLIGQWRANRTLLSTTNVTSQARSIGPLSVNEMLLAYVEFARGYQTQGSQVRMHARLSILTSGNASI